jgi:uncharacterized protein (DUF488 family)
VAAQAIPLCTIGYEGRSLDDLAEALVRNRVVRVVDVRQVPLSRKRGFSKSALAVFLSTRGITYVGARELGTPVAIRRQYKATGDFETLAREYNAYLTTVDDRVGELYQMAVDERCCLLCFERDATMCHRSLLADAVARRNGRQFDVRHV